MKMIKKMILFMILLLSCATFLCACSNSQNDNETPSSKELNQVAAPQLQLEKTAAPEEVMNCLNEVGAMTIAHNLHNLESVSSPKFSLDDIQIMEPFVIYTLQPDGTFNHNNIYYFPVVSNQNVLFTLDVFLTDTGEYQCGSSENGERLTQFLGNGACHRVYVDGGTESKAGEYNMIPVESDTRTIQTDVELTKQNINVLMNVSDAVKLEYEKLL